MPPSSSSGIARSPTMQLLANGRPIQGVMAARVRSTGYFGADHFELTLAMDPDGPFWSRETAIDADIAVRIYASTGYTRLIQGRVDSVRIDAIARTAQIEGRDYSARLIDSVVSESFSNRSSSEIAELLAQRHGLRPVVVPTKTIVGRYYQDGHQTVALDNFCGRASEWDLLAYLAQREDYDLFVSGSDLNFQPRLTEPYRVLTPADLIELHLERMLPFAGDIQVIVKTWNSQSHTADIEVARRSGGSLSELAFPLDQGARSYILVRPNLTPDAARQMAQRKLAELCMHGSSIELVMPGELTLMPRGIIQLNGTGSDFDQAYRIDEIDRRFSSIAGFIQRIRASTIPEVMAAP